MIGPLFTRPRALLSWLTVATAAASAGTLEVRPAGPRCDEPAVPVQVVPAAAADRIADSQAVSGSRNIAWAWLGSPTPRYGHPALGSDLHGGSLHALVVQPDGSQRALALELPAHRVFEDRTLRLVDLDGDGRDEIVVVESDAKLGSSLVVYGLRLGAAARQPVLAQLARGPFIGTSQRWLNPAAIADFDGDGRLDLAAVTTPHIGGVLTLYRYQPPTLEPVALLRGLSNHRNGTVEQQLAAILQGPGRRPALVIPADGLRKVRALRLDSAGQWQDQAAPLTLAAPVQRITALAGGACVQLTSGASVHVRLRE